MRKHAASLLVVFPLLVLSTTALGGNQQPTLFPEIYSFEQDPADSLPDYVCTHPTSGPGFYNFPCSAAKSAYGYGYLVIHVGSLDAPACPTVGAQCFGYGGFAGLCFGVAKAGESALYVSFTACPGFIEGFSGGQGDILVSTASGCHDWPDHPGYLKYINTSSNTGPTYFRIVKNSELGFARVINCSMEYDLGTEIGSCAAWGGTYDPVFCVGTDGGGIAWEFCQFVPVKATSWGAIKSLFR